MPLIPNSFRPGQVAASSDVNENFNAVSDALGANSSAQRIILPGDVVIGPRENALISAESDTSVNGAKSYLQLSWNAELYQNGENFQYRRFDDGEAGVQIRLGRHGFEVWMSPHYTGDLDSQLRRLFQVKATTGRDYIFVKPSFTRVEQEPSTLEDYRLTTVLFDTPKTVYENTTIHFNAIQRDARSYGVPSDAHAVLLLFEGVSTSADGLMRFLQARSPRNTKYGFLAAANAAKQVAAQGIVPLGVDGAYKSCFYEERTHTFNSASLYIQGYLI